MITNMRKIVLAVLVLAGCEEDPGSAMEQSAPTCSDLREAIVLECEAEAEALADCGPGGIDNECNAELETLNDCATEAKLAHEPSDMLDVARDLAYWCDLLEDEWMCEMAEDEAPGLGVEECPLPERF